MRVLIATDCFGTSLTASQACDIMASNWKIADPNSDIEAIPLSDGGPGFLDVLSGLTGARTELVSVADAFGQSIPARIVRLRDVAYIESAEIVGRGRYPENSENIRNGSSQGVGEILKLASQGASKVVVGLGGTATNDGGVGLLQTLGVLQSNQALSLESFANSYSANIESIDLGCEIVIASDVDNPLLGPTGASAIYAPQKGANAQDVEVLEEWMAKAVEKLGRIEIAAIQGAGAAGGIGYALLWLGAQRVSGAQLIAEEVQLAEAISRADLVVTGEGSFDWQSLRGKVVSAVAYLASRQGRPAIVIAGQVHCGRREYAALGIESAYAMAQTPDEITRSLNAPAPLLGELTQRVARTWSR